MAQVVVRNIEENVKARLKDRAALHGWSMEEEVRQILRNAVKGGPRPSVKLGSGIAARFAGVGLSEDLPEFHGQSVALMDFDA